MDNSPPQLRRAWLAAFLSLLGGPIGQIYAGSFRRSIILWIVGAFLLPGLALSAVSISLPRLSLAVLLAFAIGFPVFLAIDAWLLAGRKRAEPLKAYQRWWVYVLMIVVFAVLNNLVARGVRSSIAEAFVVPTRAMSPTIQPGDRVLVGKLWATPSTLRRGDVAVFYSEGPGSPLYIMRVVGLAGDKVEIENESVFINSERLEEQYAVFDGPLPPHVDLAEYGPVVVPLEHFFVLGDNRRLAKDSRLIGPIPNTDFYGKARTIYWSQPRAFPDPHDTSHYNLGRIRWDRIGTRLD